MGLAKAPWRLGRLIQEISHLLYSLCGEITYAYREENIMADSLANLGCDYSAALYYILTEFPLYVRGLCVLNSL